MEDDGSSCNESCSEKKQHAISDDTFIRIAQGIDNDLIQAKVMILLNIIQPLFQLCPGVLSADDIDESRLLMQKF